jgi:hypothetical protein
LLVPAPAGWPRVEVVRTVDAPSHRPFLLDDDRAEVTFANGGSMTVEREPARVTFAMQERLSTEELLHPYLAYAAGIFARWAGRLSFHAGAVLVGDNVWALLGDRESGKSSTLAWLALEGCGVLCDDVLVLDGTTAFAGPRIVDLRAETAVRLGAGERMGVVGARERWRLRGRDVSAEASLTGLVFLAWGDRVEIAPLPASERVVRLARELMLRIAPRDPGALLGLASLPCWELRRPRGLDSLAEAGGLLLRTVG